MICPDSPYIDRRDGGLFIAGTGVTLDTVVIRFEEGASPEKIAQSFPALRLGQIYGAIAYFLENEIAVLRYLEETTRQFPERRLSDSNPTLFRKLEAARSQRG